MVRTPEEQARYQELSYELSLLIFNADGINHKLIDRYDHSGNAIPNEAIVHKEALKAVNEALLEGGK